MSIFSSLRLMIPSGKTLEEEIDRLSGKKAKAQKRKDTESTYVLEVYVTLEEIHQGFERSFNYKGRVISIAFAGNSNLGFGAQIRYSRYLPDTKDLFVRLLELKLDKEASLSVNANQSYASISGGTPPQLLPSSADIPEGLSDLRFNVSGLTLCLKEYELGVQSFFNDLQLVGIEDDEACLFYEVLNVPPFDEKLYADLVLEMHRFRLAELYDQKEKIQQIAGAVGAGLAALFMQNPLSAFLGYSAGRSVSTLGNSKLNEIIPNPHLLFRQDSNSFLSMMHAGLAIPKLRRLIFHEIVYNGSHFYRVIPAFLTQDSVIPCQVFRFNRNYFMRPVAAGIENKQPEYDARKLLRTYHHHLVDGDVEFTGNTIGIIDDASDKYRLRIYRYTSRSRDLSYFYVDYQTEPSHIF